jgi:predicted Ser/Thr protein kinase
MGMATAALLRSGDVIGGFRIDDVIGVGGMAIVYRAEQVSLGRPVALKVLSSRLTSDTVFRERFRREGTHAAALEHPNIVPVYDSGEQDGNLYIAMRLVEGTNLAELIQTRGVTADQTIELLRPIASALDTAHASGLIHRDVKPQNILITSKGHPYLADFGVAKGSNTQGLTATGGFVGSVNYASPEQIRGLTLTAASDVYALTAVLYQCLTGEVPFPRETDAGVMHAHLNDPPPSLPTLTGADSDFHTVLARGMAKDPGARYGHAGDLINAAALSVGRLPIAKRTSVPAFPPTDDCASPERTAGQTAADRDGGSNPAAPAEVHAPSDLTEADRRRPALPEPPAAPRDRRRLLGAIVAGLVVAAVAVAIVAIAGSSGSSARTIDAGNLILKANSAWKSTDTSVRGLHLGDHVGLRSGDIAVAAGQVSAPSTIPAAVSPALVTTWGSPSRSVVVSLPLGLARRYSWQKNPLGALVAFVVATEHGESTIACTSPPARIAAMESACSELADSARIVGTRVQYPGADPKVAGALDAALAARTRAIKSASHGAAAHALTARAPALATLSAREREVARTIAAIPAPFNAAGAIGELSKAIAGEASLIASLAHAGLRSNRALYDSLLRQLSAASPGRYSRELANIGYPVASLRAPGFPQAPVPAVHHHELTGKPSVPSTVETPQPSPTQVEPSSNPPPVRTKTGPTQIIITPPQ